MERKARFGGWELHVQQDPQGFSFKVTADPERQQARDEVFHLLDQLNQAAKTAGVTTAELVLHSVRSRLDRWVGRSS